MFKTSFFQTFTFGSSFYPFTTRTSLINFTKVTIIFMARKDLCIGIQGKNLFIDAVVQLSSITSVAKLKGGSAVLATEI